MAFPVLPSLRTLPEFHVKVSHGHFHSHIPVRLIIPHCHSISEQYFLMSCDDIQLHLYLNSKNISSMDNYKYEIFKVMFAIILHPHIFLFG
jgi:hypothetical protein